MKKVLLYSGGLDSWLIDKLWKPDIKLYISTNTDMSKSELKRMPSDVIIKELDLSEFESKEDNFLLPNRNLFFVIMASYFGENICLGATGTSTHFDKTDHFVRSVSNLLTYLDEESKARKIKIEIPYANKTKEELLQMYIKGGGDAGEAWIKTFSCYSPINDKECGECSSCLKKRKAFKVCGYEF